jgi:hypothetical protein
MPTAAAPVPGPEVASGVQPDAVPVATTAVIALPDMSASPPAGQISRRAEALNHRTIH